MTLVGYARVSTQDQSLAMQHDALRKAGCAEENIHSDQASGKLASRPALDKALAILEPGDTLIVWKLDRLGRSVRNLVEIVGALEERKVGFRSLTENIDTTTNGGKLIFHVFAAVAEFERGLIQERTEAGLAAARAQGRRGGRPPGLDPRRVKLARQMHDSGETVSEIAKVMRVSRATVYRHLEAGRSE